MDNVLVDFQSGLDRIDEKTKEEYKGHEDDIPGLFSTMPPWPGAIEAFEFLVQHFDIYILSTAPWNNPSAWIDKRKWVEKYLPKAAYKRLIITHHKNLNKGDYLIDDRLKHGVIEFEGEHIHFGKGEFKEWQCVIDYLCEKEKILINT